MRDGYVLRSPVEADLPAVAEAVSAAERASDPTAAARTVAGFRHEWASLDPARDVWVVTGPDGEVCGYGQVGGVREGRVIGDAYTRPGHLGQGVGTALLTRMEARAAELPRPVVLVNYVLLDGAADRMLRARGYARTRVHQRMRIAVDGPREKPVWPDGVTVRSCDGTSEDLLRVHECAEDSFGDRWGHAPRSYDEWAADLLYEGFDPDLWLLAERDGRTVGVALCQLREVEGRPAGEVSQLGVRREARRLGLGRSLLLASFALFAGRGIDSVGLDVDSTSPTGAHRLYERVGMKTTTGIAQFERALSTDG
ncbi:GNAT family N-acetyltransferase [Streptomyces sp. NBC_00370]|uniref:GNAT family N-acetyltransferase n=1 Tax=Streptomyces sp. NBC_00370 TaxID=2975728 RepID=UPI002E25CB14